MADSEIRILLVGASGRMGREVVASVQRKAQTGEKITVVGGLVDERDGELGKNLAGIPGVLRAEWNSEFESANVIVDFSGPGGTKKAISIAGERKIPLLICTTGLSKEIRAAAEKVAQLVPVIIASNTSVGVNALFKLVYQATQMVGLDFDVEISETHHKMKKDAPGGTALSLGEQVAKARGEDLRDILVEGRSGAEALRKKGELGINAVRGGDVVGEHTVYFFGAGERIELTHRATSRAIFADGAVRAAQWLVGAVKAGKSAGMFSMADVISGSPA